MNNSFYEGEIYNSDITNNSIIRDFKKIEIYSSSINSSYLKDQNSNTLLTLNSNASIYNSDIYLDNSLKLVSGEISGSNISQVGKVSGKTNIVSCEINSVDSSLNSLTCENSKVSSILSIGSGVTLKNTKNAPVGGLINYISGKVRILDNTVLDKSNIVVNSNHATLKVSGTISNSYIDSTSDSVRTISNVSNKICRVFELMELFDEDVKSLGYQWTDCFLDNVK